MLKDDKEKLFKLQNILCKHHGAPASSSVSGQRCSLCASLSGASSKAESHVLSKDSLHSLFLKIATWKQIEFLSQNALFRMKMTSSVCSTRQPSVVLSPDSFQD